MKTEQEENHAKDQAAAQLESIREMVTALDTQDDDAREEAEQTIHEDALSVEVRGDWHTPDQVAEDSEFRILLCTGGPAVQIVGELGKYNEPETVRLQFQDWGTPWTDYVLSAEDEKTLLRYARCFYFEA